jgi:hypothetical protein
MSNYQTLIQNFVEEVWNKGNFDATETYWAANYVDHMASGKIAERWGNFDPLGLLHQLGLIPAPRQG